MWGLKPFRGTASGIKPENSFSALSPLSPTVARGARHSHPSPPEEKAASRKKSRLRRKKTAPDAKKWRIVCVKGGIFLPMILATTDPPRLTSLVPLSPSCASGFAFRLHGVFHNTPSPTAELVAIGGISISFFVGGMFLCLRWGKKIRRGATFDVFVLWRKRMGRLRFLVCGEAMLNFYF